MTGVAAEPRHERVNLCEPGQVLGATYRVERLIGTGGMGEVYEVEHLRLGARFAAKVLRRGHEPWPDAVRRFRREATALATVNSEHVVKVFDVSESEVAPPFYAMELLEGQDLRRLLAQEGALEVARAVSLLMGACLGVAAMHDAGLVHRDLKPANLFVTRRDNGSELCKLLDFGVTKRENVPVTTSPGAFVGTLRYVPPEQIEDSATVGKRADVYALAVILYEALAGRPAHGAETVERLIYSILNTTPESIRALNPNVPEDLAELLRRAMARDAEARLPRVLEFYDELSAFLVRHGPSTTTTVRERELPPASRPRAPISTAVRIGVLGLGTVAALTALAMRGQSGPDHEATVQAGPPATITSPEPGLTLANITPSVIPVPATATSVAAESATQSSAPSKASAISRPAHALPVPTSSTTASPPSRPVLHLELKNPYDR